MAIIAPKQYDVGVYSNLYLDPGYNITQIPLTYDTIYLFQSGPIGGGAYAYSQADRNRIGTGTTSGSDATSAAAVATCQNRGQAVIMTLGGSNAGFNFQMEHVDACVASIKAENTKLGGTLSNPAFSGISWNTYEEGPGRLGDPEAYVAICQRLRNPPTGASDPKNNGFGPDFRIHADPAAGTYGGAGQPPNYFDRKLMCRLVNAGCITYLTPQFYDDSSLWDPYYISFDGKTGGASGTGGNLGLSEWLDIIRRSYYTSPTDFGPYVRTLAQAASFIGQALGAGNYGGGGPLDGATGSVGRIRRNLQNVPQLRAFVAWSGYDDNSTAAQVSGAGPHPRWEFGTRYNAIQEEFATGTPVTPVPVLSFDYNPKTGDVPISVSVTASATNSPTSYNWTTSDGHTSTLQNPTFNFTTPGTKSITGTASNAGGASTAVTKTFQLTGTVAPDPVVTLSAPVFNKSTYGRSEQLQMSTTVTVTNQPYTTTQHILTLRRPGGTDAGGPYDDISVLPGQVFQVGTSNFQATYNFPSTVPVGQWYGYQTYQRPSDGQYTLGPKTYFTLQEDAVVPVPVANFNLSATSGIAPFSVTVTDTSTNSPNAWAWTTDDGQTSTAQNPTFNFITPGEHTITLRASNSGGQSTPVTKTVTVTSNPVIPPVDTSTTWLAFRKKSIDVDDILKRRRDGYR